MIVESSSDKVFDRFQFAQLVELINYLTEDERSLAGVIVDRVRSEEFTQAAMAAGELDYCRALRRRIERNVSNRKEDD